MPMSMVIQEKRRELGLTQEQVARYLGVTTPAVSKWEKGITCPDIALLPSLARLLKIDLNTLFCFHEDLTVQEISDLCKSLRTTADEKGVPAAFAQAEELLHSYPHNEVLMQNVALSLDGMLLLSGMADEEAAALDEQVEAWYRRLSGSVDTAIRNLSNYMLVSRSIRRGNLEKAQETLDTMPDRDDMAAEYADKRVLQVNIHMKQGKPELAAKALERALLSAATKVQVLLLKLADAEWAAGEKGKAEYIAKVSRDMVELFDLWECSAYTAAMSLAMEEKDKEKMLPLLHGMLNAALKPWDMAASPLYHRIAGKEKRAMDQGLAVGLLNQLSQDPQYEFLREDGRFQSIIDVCRRLAAMDLPQQNT